MAASIGFVGLLAASLLTDHCAQDARFCADVPALAAETPDADPAPQKETATMPSTKRDRQVLDYAFEPLPFSMDGEAQRAYLLPPGRDVRAVATLEARISSDQIVLLGVITEQSVRRALIRRANGEVLHLKAGDRLDGSTVAAIGENAVYLLKEDMTPYALILGG